MNSDKLHLIGYDNFFESDFLLKLELIAKNDESLRSRIIPARVICSYGPEFRLASDAGELPAYVPGKLKNILSKSSEMPAVGDWVAAELPAESKAGCIKKAPVRAILKRKTVISRMSSSGRVTGRKGGAQILAANVDVAFVVFSATEPLHRDLILKFLAVAVSGGARPVLILNKCDLVEKPEALLAALSDISGTATTHAVSAFNLSSTMKLTEELGKGQTGVLIGPSGVGKSTLINTLLGEERLTTRETGPKNRRGRHGTVRRELVVLPDMRGILIDTPGLRELAFYDFNIPLKTLFPDIEKLARLCRFSNCNHFNEPGCAVLEALRNGKLEISRLESWRQHFLEAKEMERKRKILEKKEQDRLGKKKILKKYLSSDTENIDEGEIL